MNNHNRIFRYTLQDTSACQEALMRRGSKILSVQFQTRGISFWASHDTEEHEFELRRFVVVLTGERIPHPGSAEYLGTCQSEGGTYVQHVFEIK